MRGLTPFTDPVYVCIVLIADGAGGTAGEGLGFRDQVVAGVVGKVAF